MNEYKQVIFKVGAALGVAFSAAVLLAHFRGVTHMPGDNVSWINVIIFSVVTMVAGNQYRNTLDDALQFNYKKAFGFVFRIIALSTGIFTVFMFLYYKHISPQDLTNILNQIEIAFKQMGTIPDDQMGALLKLYEQALTPGNMAFVTLIFQFVGNLLFGLILANIIRTKNFQI